MSEDSKKEMTRQFEEIFNKNQDPIERAKKRIEKNREEQEKEIKSDLGL